METRTIYLIIFLRHRSISNVLDTGNVNAGVTHIKLQSKTDICKNLYGVFYVYGSQNGVVNVDKRMTIFSVGCESEFER